MRKKTVFIFNEFREINYFLREDLQEGRDRVERYAIDIWVRFFKPWLVPAASWVARHIDGIITVFAWALSIEVVILAIPHINFWQLFK